MFYKSRSNTHILDEESISSTTMQITASAVVENCRQTSLESLDRQQYRSAAMWLARGGLHNEPTESGGRWGLGMSPAWIYLLPVINQFSDTLTCYKSKN